MRFFKPYTPTNALPNVGYLRDDNGVDWYAAQADYPIGKLVIGVDTNKRICTAGRDVSGLFPAHLAVVLIDEKDIPKGFDTSKPWDWDFRDGRIVAHVSSEEDQTSSPPPYTNT